jgi:hypothetical protein
VQLVGGSERSATERAIEDRVEAKLTEQHAVRLAQSAGRDVGEVTRAHAAREVAERVGWPLSPEQHKALEVITGPERAAVLVGPAGTGKGVVIDVAARAEQFAGRETIGVAVSGSTASGSAPIVPRWPGRHSPWTPWLLGQTRALSTWVATPRSSWTRPG